MIEHNRCANCSAFCENELCEACKALSDLEQLDKQLAEINISEDECQILGKILQKNFKNGEVSQAFIKIRYGLSSSQMESIIGALLATGLAEIKDAFCATPILTITKKGTKLIPLIKNMQGDLDEN